MEAVQREGDALVAAVREGPRAPVAAYEGWTNADLARHVGRVLDWVTGILVDRASERRPMAPADVDDGEVAGWLVARTAALVEVLADTDPGEEVWTISRVHTTAGFWRRRMALEVTLHRWDAEDALGAAPQLPQDLAGDGIEETLRVYLEQRLGGRPVGGAGQRVGLAPPDGEGWTLSLDAEGVTVDDGLAATDAVVRGTAGDLWLLLCCRRPLEALRVEGDRDAAALAVRAAHLVPGPAG